MGKKEAGECCNILYLWSVVGWRVGCVGWWGFLRPCRGGAVCFLLSTGCAALCQWLHSFASLGLGEGEGEAVLCCVMLCYVDISYHEPLRGEVRGCEVTFACLDGRGEGGAELLVEGEEVFNAGTLGRGGAAVANCNWHSRLGKQEKSYARSPPTRSTVWC